jgi:hypothetical protein
MVAVIARSTVIARARDTEGSGARSTPGGAASLSSSCPEKTDRSLRLCHSFRKNGFSRTGFDGPRPYWARRSVPGRGSRSFATLRGSRSRLDEVGVESLAAFGPLLVPPFQVGRFGHRR